jgi:hypothetical protein
MVTILSAVGRYRSGEIDYYNSDATWHTLLTIEAYNETPVSQHLFLPIVSLGGTEDKGIPWGATIPDSEGNYYYTSFSPMGYFLPWLFMKVFHLPICEKSLYIFNCLLLVISSGLMINLLSLVYQDNKNRTLLCFLGGIIYVLMPEILHGMGIVYWHQSILQVTLLLQIIAYYQYAVLDNKKYKMIFYILAFLNPYTEWTGYVANVGFALAEIILNCKNNWKKGFGKAVLLGFISIAAFGIFTLHYMLRIDAASFFAALRSRFLVRGVTSNNGALSDFILGYLKSFKYAWILLVILMIWCFIKTKKLELTGGILWLIMSFPVLENIIMKQHALTYTYDRMKAAWILVFLICEVIRNILDNSRGKEKALCIGLFTLVACLSLANYKSYVGNRSYIWQVDYKESNQKMADYINANYPDALFASGSTVRGYANLLFGRGIYEGENLDQAADLAMEKGKNMIVYIKFLDGYQIQSVSVYDNALMECAVYRIENGVVVAD